MTEWRESGMTAEAFAAHRGLSRTSLFKWTGKLEQQAAKSTAPAGFVAVKVVADGSARSSLTTAAVPGSAESPASAASGPIELVALSGRVIRLSGRVDRDALACVLEAAERC